MGQRPAEGADALLEQEIDGGHRHRPGARRGAPLYGGAPPRGVRGALEPARAGLGRAPSRGPHPPAAGLRGPLRRRRTRRASCSTGCGCSRCSTSCPRSRSSPGRAARWSSRSASSCSTTARPRGRATPRSSARGSGSCAAWCRCPTPRPGCGWTTRCASSCSRGASRPRCAPRSTRARASTGTVRPGRAPDGASARCLSTDGSILDHAACVERAGKATTGVTA